MDATTADAPTTRRLAGPTFSQADSLKVEQAAKLMRRTVANFIAAAAVHEAERVLEDDKEV